MADRRNPQSGVTLIEILMGLMIVAVASIGTMTYFSHVLGKGIGRQSNRRAALELARQRLEQLMEADVNSITPPGKIVDQEYFVTCNKLTGLCATPTLADPGELVTVEDLPTQQPLQSTVTCRHDAASGTPPAICDVLELGTKVWFISGSSVIVNNDDPHRVHMRTFRTPSA